MSDSIRIGQLFPGRMQPGALQQSKGTLPSADSKTSFKELLDNSLVRFSNHAAKRLEQRGIELKPEEVGKIGKAIDNAAAKGAKDSLILMKDMAFIVNVHNRTVVTAMDENSMKDNVFTQIDSAVIIH